MLEDALGYRQASIGDMFTGQSRWDPKVTREFEKLALGVFGNKAYTSMIALENGIQEVVTNAKVLIVVKSMIVPAANLMSNMFQLVNRGVPVRHILRGVPRKTAEINEFIKRRALEVDLETELRAATAKNNLVDMRVLGNRIKSLKDSYRRMSIWPLIEAGEFSAISSGQVTAEDLALANGKWSTFVESYVTV
jgi:hypothetical protein